MGFGLSSTYLKRYADLLVGFALGGGAGIRRGEVVHVIAPESAKPLYVELCRAVWRAGGNVIGEYLPDDDERASLSRDFYALASDAQLRFFPAAYARGRLEEIDHAIQVRATADPRALRDADPARLVATRRAWGPLMEWEQAKESAGRLSWTVCLYGTQAMAAEARLSIEEYWQQIIQGCFLDHPDPKATWRAVDQALRRYIAALNGLPIERLHVEGEDVDLWIALGQQRRWVSAEGRNIPSFEIATSPDWRGTDGWMRFNQPLYIHGSLITGIELEFRDGVVTRATANENQELLLELLATENADRVGEFSLTDARMSRIERFMADTLFDENTGGPFGNTYIALGHAAQYCYDGDPGQLSAADWERLGFNQSAVHADIVSTTDRRVTAIMRDRSRRTIYASGQFELDRWAS